MKVFLLLVGVCGLVVLSTANKICDNMTIRFESCLAQGYRPKTLEGCRTGNGELDEKALKKCEKLEKNLIKKCKYSCKDFVPDRRYRYMIKKVGEPGNGQVISVHAKSRRSYESWFANLAPDARSTMRNGNLPFVPTKSTDCDCKVCIRFSFHAEVSSESWNLVLSCQGDRRPNGNSRATIHKSPGSPEDEYWCVEPAEGVGRYKLKKAHGHEKGRYLVVGEARDGWTYWVDLADSDVGAVWSLEKH